MPTISGITLNGVSFRGSDSAAPEVTEYLAVTLSISPFLSIYPFNTTTGFGSRYANAATQPSNASGTGCLVGWDPSGNWIAGGFSNTIPRLRAWKFDTVTGLGNRMTLSDGGPPREVLSAVAWSPSGNVLIATQTSGGANVIAYKTNTASTSFPNGLFVSTYANAATRPAGPGRGITWNPAGNIVAISHNTTPNVSVYPFNESTGWGTKYSNPATPVNAGSDGGCWHPNGNVLVLASGLSPWLNAYRWSNATGFVSKYTNPSTLPADAYGTAFSPSGNVVFVAMGGSSAVSSPYARAYRFDAGNNIWGAVYSDPSTGVGMNVYTVSINKSGTLVALAGNNNGNPFMVYRWNDVTGWGTRYLGPNVGFSSCKAIWRPSPA